MREAKILFLMDELPAISAGGTERQMLQMIAGLAGTGFLPHLCVLRGTRWLTPDTVGCPVRHESIRTFAGPAALLQLLRLVAWMRRERFAILQTFFFESNLLGPLLARLAGIPVVLGSRRNLNHWMGPAARFAQRLSNCLATRLVANSGAVRRSIAKTEHCSPAKIDVLYNGIDTLKFAPDHVQRQLVRAQLAVEPGDILIVNVSTLWPVKGPEMFVQMAALLSQRVRKTRFLLIGEGPMRPQLENMVARLGLSDRFLFLGAQEEVVPFLHAADIAVLSSAAEGFSNSLLEYMAAGLPSVVTDVGGNAEAMSAAGVLVPPARPDLMAEAVIALIEDPPRRRALSESARARVLQRFSLPQARESLVCYYRALLQERGRTGAARVSPGAPLQGNATARPSEPEPEGRSAMIGLQTGRLRKDQGIASDPGFFACPGARSGSASE